MRQNSKTNKRVTRRVVQRRAQTKPARLFFSKHCISLSSDCAAFAALRAAEPEYAGNMSAYIRSLILADNKENPAASGQ